MRPLKLMIQAFGPYSQVEIIDFTLLEENRLFLITGPTGSGKTTIFDAISYAIYGLASGTLRGSDTFRSQFAQDDLLTSVTLDFELRNKRYSIHREPKQLRPKTRGEGFTEHKGDVNLRVDIDGNEKVYTGSKEVEIKIESLLGIDAGQFKQIMMLPQGEFRKLLVSDSLEREQILKKLFDTSLFNRVQFSLEQQAKELYKAVERDRTLKISAIKRLTISDEQTEGEHSNSEDFILQSVESYHSELKESITILETKIAQLDKDIADQVSKKEQATAINKRFGEIEVLSAKLDQLKSQEEDYRSWSESLAKAKFVEKLMPQYKLLKQLKQRTETTTKQIDTSKKELEQVASEYKINQIKLDELLSEKEQSSQKKHKEDLVYLKGFLTKVESLKMYEDNLNKGMTIQKDQQVQLDTKQKEHVQVQQSIDLIEVGWASSKDALIEISEKEKSFQAISQAIASIDQCIKLDNECKSLILAKDKLLDRVNELKALFDQANERHLSGKMQYHLNQAAILAEMIQTDEPCPVCGSKDHPDIAKSVGNTITVDQLEQLESLVNKTRKDYQESSQEHMRLEEQLKGLTDQLKQLLADINIDSGDLEQVRQQKSDEQSKLEEAIKVLKSLVVSEAKYLSDKNDLQEKLKQVEEKELSLKTSLEATEAGLLNLKGRIESIEEEVPENLRDLGILHSQVKSLETSIDTHESEVKIKQSHADEFSKRITKLETELSLMTSQLNASKEEYTSVNIKFETDIEANQNLTNEGFEASIILVDQMESLQTRMSDYEESIKRLSIEKETIEKQVAGQSKVSLEAFDETLTKYYELRKDLTEQKNNKFNTISQNQDILSEIETYNTRLGKKEGIYKQVGHLSNITKGKNTKRLSFERFVLAAFLDDILQAANVRLLEMTDNRYYLERSEAVRSHKAQSGLELEVFDYYTGKSRHVKTLSGGESFKASLAMALGLSDVVQSYAGGVRLDTMFIDEGFGTLDQESLDGAIKCLIDLQNTGRMVGIISHVTELKERIGTRLEVTSSQSGSSARFIV